MTDPRSTLLFVDDEEDIREILSKTFERRFRVLTAASAAEALRVLGEEHVDVLVTDQRMPGMTGIELAAAARGRGFGIPVILLTAFTEADELIAAINKGEVYRYVTKPWDVNDLIITVKNAVEVSTLRRDKDRLLQQLNQRVEALSVLYEVSQQSAKDAHTHDAIIERVLAAVARVLPYDCGAALVTVDDGRSATLRLRCAGSVQDKSLLAVKDATLNAYRKQSGLLLTEDRVMTRVTGTTNPDEASSSFASQLSVLLMDHGEVVGTLMLFSLRPRAYGPGDAELLDVLANQTVGAIRALRASEEQHRRRLQQTVESMADGVLLTDEQGEIVVLNPAAQRLLHLGAEPAEWSGRQIEQLLGIYAFEVVRGWEYGGVNVLREEIKLFDKDIAAAITPVADARGAFKGVCVVLRDITEQKQHEERKEEFVSIISHELRTPLTSISGALDLVLNLIDGGVSDKQHRYLAIAKDSADKLNAIVDDLLDLSKFSKGRLKMSFEVTSLDELVVLALDRYGPVFAQRNITVSKSLPERALRLVADPQRLEQVLSNLLTNAAKFTPVGGEVHVELRPSVHVPGFIALSCWNSGEALPEADLERIFDKFEQARTVRTRTVRGTGLGLAICRNIVEAHGGRIWAEPSESGALFVAVLPTEPPESPETDREPPRLGAGTPQSTVLIVQDGAEEGLILKSLLLGRVEGVVLSRSAQDAIARARAQRPELILLDVAQPDLDGIRLTDVFRHDPATRQVPVLVVSAPGERQRAFRQGARAFLQTPLSPSSLLATVESLLRGPAGRRQGTVLVVDDDASIRTICLEVLVNLGFEAWGAGCLGEAREILAEKRPDLMLLDLSLPDGDGLAFLEELKAERASSSMSVICISAKAETSSKVRALRSGGEDYLTKPFDALELGARVESVFRRREHELGFSPTTQLPGSLAIEREVQRRLHLREPFAFCYLDLDNLKAYNDYYGFAKADGVVRQTGDLLREVIARAGRPGDFLGHVAGDDFVFIAHVESVDATCQKAIEAFDRIIPLYYDKQDRERGYIDAEDRFGERRRFPLMSVSVVAVLSDGITHDHAELSRRAAEMKKRAKSIPGSVYLRSDSPVATSTLPSVG